MRARMFTLVGRGDGKFCNGTQKGNLLTERESCFQGCCGTDFYCWKAKKCINILGVCNQAFECGVWAEDESKCTVYYGPYGDPQGPYKPYMPRDEILRGGGDDLARI